jgi:hypothetical protein
MVATTTGEYENERSVAGIPKFPLVRLADGDVGGDLGFLRQEGLTFQT